MRRSVTTVLITAVLAVGGLTACGDDVVDDGVQQDTGEIGEDLQDGVEDLTDGD